ncbi:MAG: toprim domain-containing protein [Ignavibacteriales bacterium]|nr:toprim domain-containing protein [Ignavibacteriales bacterium]
MFYLPKEHDIKAALTNSDPEIKESVVQLKLQGRFGDNFRLAFPYRNAEGLITGFLKRATNPKGISVTTYDNKVHDNVRWDSTPGLMKDDLFGIDKVRESTDTIIAVEGYPDALYLKALGLDNITAVGQGVLGKKHLEELRRRKVKNLVLAFDNDKVGPSNTIEVIELVLKNSKITPYVIDPKSYGDKVKDPDEYTVKHGFEMLKNLFQTKAEDGAVWIVKGLVTSYQSSSTIEKKEIKNKVLDFLSLVKDETTITGILES